LHFFENQPQPDRPGGHPLMPTFTLGPRDIAAIVRYLRSIQEQ